MMIPQSLRTQASPTPWNCTEPGATVPVVALQRYEITALPEHRWPKLGDVLSIEGNEVIVDHIVRRYTTRPEPGGGVSLQNEQVFVYVREPFKGHS